MPSSLTVEPVTPETWVLLERLFTTRGAPYFCWCMTYRARDVGTWDATEKRTALQQFVLGGTPTGLVASIDGVPIGWCSVAPRESYVRLEKSRTMPRRRDAPTWTILCLFVLRSHRGRGVSRELVDGAVRYARAGGAVEVEAWPHDAAGVSSTHRGRAALYESAGFVVDGSRRVRRWNDPTEGFSGA